MPADQGSGDYVTVALDYPRLGPDSDKYDAWPLLDPDWSRRLAYAAPWAWTTRAWSATCTRSGATCPARRVARSLNGTGTVLFEVRGQSDDWGQKMKGRLVTIVENGVNGIATRLADGTVELLDGDRFFDLPDYGWDD